MKRTSGMILTVLCMLALLCIPAFAVNGDTVSSALSPLSEDLGTLPQKITKLAVYGVSGDSEGRYNPARIRGIIEKEISENKRLSLVNRKNLKDSIKEMELGASGAVDFNSVKEAGRVSGVDAFVFAYPAVSGRGDRRITVMIKVVDVTSGAVVFVDEYSAEERPFFSLSIGMKFIPAYTGAVHAAFFSENSSQPDWSYDTELSYSIMAELMAGIAIEPINSSIIAGMAVMPLSKPEQGIDLPAEAEWVNDIQYEYVRIYGLEASMELQFFGGINFPISSLFAPTNEVLRGRIMYGYGMVFAGGGGETSISLDDDVDTDPGAEQFFFENVEPLKFHVIRLGVDVALASSINLVLDFDYIIGSSAETPRTLNSWYRYEVKSGIVFSAGLAYRIF